MPQATLPFRNDSDLNGLCSQLPDMRSVGNIALNPSLGKSKLQYIHHFSWYRINSCKLFLSMYTFLILTMRLFAWRNSVIG